MSNIGAGRGHVGEPDTSMMAFKEAGETTMAMRKQIALIGRADKANGNEGLTRDQYEVLTGRRAQTVTATIRGLVKDGSMSDGPAVRQTRQGKMARVLHWVAD